jgi:enterochelin esterase-like enzyme
VNRTRWASGPLDWSLLTGAVPVVVAVLGGAALLALCLSRRRHWFTRWLPLALLLAAGLSWLIAVAVDDWWQPFPEGLPTTSAVWIGVAVLGLCVALFRVPGLRWRGWIGALLAVVLVVLLSASQVNQEFQQYPTLRDAPGPWQVPAGALSAADHDREATVAVPPGKTLEDVWDPPAGLPARGTLSSTPIPGTRSGFVARNAYVYLPPAYQARPRPLLPVLVLMAGQPGSPEDWITSGQLVSFLDAYAADHHGLAPVVAVVDPLGSELANTLCMDSKIAKVQTYLAEDVPDWISAHLQVASGRRARVIGGLSFGGTCALQLAVNAPAVYGDFLDLSGQDEPTLGTRSQTVSEAFGGDTAAFLKVDPLAVMAHTSFPDTSAALVVGASDTLFGPQQQRVLAACRRAGMQANLLVLPGGHDWKVWWSGLSQELPWIGRTTGLTP